MPDHGDPDHLGIRWSHRKSMQSAFPPALVRIVAALTAQLSDLHDEVVAALKHQGQNQTGQTPPHHGNVLNPAASF